MAEYTATVTSRKPGTEDAPAAADNTAATTVTVPDNPGGETNPPA